MRKELSKILDQYFNEEIHTFTLSNGLRVLFKEDHSTPITSTQIWVNTGSIHEDQFLGTGISHYLEHMLFKGTKKRNYHQLSEEIHDAGGSVNAYTTFDRTVYHIDGPANSLETYIDILADMAFNSTLDPKETKKEQSVILREIDMGLDDPDHKLSRDLFSTVFHTHPYRLPVIGEKELFKTITVKDLKHYYKSRYTPSNMTLIVVGASTRDQVEQLAKSYLEPYPDAPLKPIYIPNEPPQLSPRALHNTGNYEITRGGITFRIPNLAHPDSPGLNLLANLLGQGQSSHLWQTLREKQKLVHSISSSTWNPGSSGLFMISYTCDPGMREKVEDAIIQELKNFLKKPIPKTKLDKCITQAIVGEVNVRKTMRGQAARLGIADVVIRDLNYPKTFLQHLQAVTPTTLKQLHKKYLTPNTMTSISLEAKSLEKIKKKAKVTSTIPDFSLSTLSNGVRIASQTYNKVPKVHIRIMLNGGPLYEDPKKRGITGILATLLTKDTQKRSASKVAETIEQVGGYFTEFAGNNSFGLGAEVMSHDLKLASSLLQEALLNPNFKKQQFETEKEAQIAAIREEFDEILAHGIRNLRQKYYGQHPYRDDPLGQVKTVQSITLQDIKKHYKSLLHPSNIVVAISGDVSEKDFLKEFNWLKQLKADSRSNQKLPQFKGPKPGQFTKKLDREQVVVMQAYPGTGVHDKDFETLEVIDELMSGMSSQLFVQVREEKAMAYYVGSTRMIGVQTGMFYFYAGTNPDSYKQVFKEFDKQVKRLTKGDITKVELERAKTRLKATHLMGLQTPGARAMQVGLDVLYGLPINHWKSYPDRIDGITKKSIQDFAKQHLTKDQEVRYSIGKL